MEEIAKDSRFSHILKDAKFRKLPERKAKVKVDKRFQSMFKDKKFQLKNKVDKRGRSANLGNSEDLKRYYDLSENDESDTEVEKKSNVSLDNKNVEVSTTSEEDRKTLTPQVKKKLKDSTIDYARGEGAILSDSSSDEEDPDLVVRDQPEVEHDWGQLDQDAESTDEPTRRLAVCNMNWDRIEAADLMVVLNSFLPPGGMIESVTVYPSEFGLQRMKEEEEKGPTELTETVPEEDNGEMDAVQMEKLRKYQLNRLKYYYAVVVCDTAATADALYEECDGMEYESSSSKLDLRFIPDDTSFSQEPRETCTSIPDLTSYKPKLFTTSALTKAKVDLTWDETDPTREEVVKSIHGGGNLDESKLKKYLACSSSDEEESVVETKDKSKTETKSESGDVDKYKALLAEIEDGEKEKKKKDVDMEVTWNLKLETKASEDVKEATKEKEKKTPFEQYLDKRKEKKNNKKRGRKAKRDEANQKSGESAFSDDEIPSDIDLNDPYFKEEMGGKGSKGSKGKGSKGRKGKNKKPAKEEESEESKRERAMMELMVLGDESEIERYNVEEIEEGEKSGGKKKGEKRKRKGEESDEFNDDFNVNVDDERFEAMYTSHHFNVDPSYPRFKVTESICAFLKEKIRRRCIESEEESDEEEASGKRKAEIKNNDPELSSLVQNIKKNAREIRKRSRRNLLKAMH